MSAKKGEQRSRSPPGNNKSNATASKDDPKDDGFAAIWDTVGPKLDNKLGDFATGFKEEVKGVVNSMVKTHVERLEKKIDSNQQLTNTNIKNLEKQMDDKFSDLEGNLLKAIQASKDAPGPPPAPAPGGSSGGEVRQALRSSPLSFADAVVAGAQQSAGNDVTTPNFNRKLNPTKLFCNLHDRVKVAKAKFEQAISVLAGEANLSDSDYKIIGEPLDNRFELQFAGDNRMASVSALQFYDSLHLGRGLFKDQFVVDDQSNQVKFYVNPDKNPCQMRREILAKHLRAILASKVADKTLFLKKQTGSVLEGKRAICSVIITGPESARLEWCHPKRIEMGIEQVPVEQEFSAFVIGGGPGS